LLHENSAGWFADDGARLAAIQAAFVEALDWLEQRLGPDVSSWRWGAIHRLGVRHPAARTPLQREFLDLPPLPHQGGAGTVANAAYAPPGQFETRSGANYRFLATLNAEGETWAVSYPGQSGQPGSPHYADQVQTYLAGSYYALPTTRAAVEVEADTWIHLLPT
jgi:penicillin amidase